MIIRQLRRLLKQSIFGYCNAHYISFLYRKRDVVAKPSLSLSRSSHPNYKYNIHAVQSVLVLGHISSLVFPLHKWASVRSESARSNIPICGGLIIIIACFKPYRSPCKYTQTHDHHIQAYIASALYKYERLENIFNVYMLFVSLWK